jgi:DNA-binding response OmpR family regulator
LSSTADQLLAEARAACVRDAVPASKQELLARVAARIGLSQSEVAHSLRLKRHQPRPARPHADDPVVTLAASILGRREHTVFLARRNAPPNDARTLHQLATELGVSIERIYQLEASALHKLATALR